MSPKILIFDLDNTLIDRNASIKHMHRWLVDQYLSTYTNEAKEAARAQLKQWDYFGYVPHETVLRNFCKTYGLDFDIKEVATYIRTHQGKYAHRLDGVEETLKALHHNYTLAILTNGSSMGQRLKLDTALGTLQSLFQEILITGDLGVHKPNLKVYTEMCQRLDVLPQDCVYIGDDLLNDILAPMKFGMKAIRLNHCNLTPTTLTHEITKFTQLLDIDFNAL